MKRSFTRFLRTLDQIGLRQPLEEQALEAHVTLRDLYEGQGRSPSISAARKRTYTWLHHEKGKGINEIARLFDRAPSGVMRLVQPAAKMRKARGRAKRL